MTKEELQEKCLQMLLGNNDCDDWAIFIQKYSDQETQRLKAELEIVENYNDMLISELTELKEKHKEDVETAFSEGLFLPHDSDLTAEQYYNETHKTK